MEVYWLIVLVIVPTFVEGSCPKDWVGYNDSCYRIFAYSYRGVRAKTWEDARTYCKSLGADLVSIGSEGEGNFIRRQVGPYRAAPFWIGLFRNSSRTNPRVGWVWTDGTEFRYKNWAWGEPNNFRNSEKCGEVYGNSARWNDINCTEVRSFICEGQKGFLVPTVETARFTTPKPEVICDLGWNAFRKSCYRIFDIKRTWYTAKTGCASFGAHLLKIDDQTELDYFHNELKDRDDGRYWIGLIDRQGNGNWQWESDGRAPNVTNWYKGQPNGRGSRRCVEMYGGRLAPFWNDLYCSVPSKYICENEGGKPGCPDDWTSYGDICYQFNLAESQLKNWPAAEQACKSVGDFSSLVSILNEDEQSFLTKEIATVAKSAVWIGLNDRQSEHVYKWSDNSKVDYQNWITKTGKSANQPLKDCAVLLGMRTDGVWTMESCSEPRRYVCKRKRAMFDCDAPLGMENGNIRDDQISAKSSLSITKGPLKSRLRSNGTWCPKNKNDYLQIDLGSSYKIRKIAVQGFATLYCIEHGIDGKTFKQYGSPTTQASTCKRLKSEASDRPHFLQDLEQFVARFIRVIPIQGSNKCLRLELYGCLSESTITNAHRQAKWKTIPLTTVQFQINHVTRSWEDARSFCLEQKADLLSMSTPAIARYMTRQLNSLRPFAFWIGLNDRDYASMFYWTNGDPVNYIAWGTSSPSRGSYDCVQYRRYRSSWRTSNCAEVRPFVCMKKGPTPKRLSSGVVGNGVTGVWISSATLYWPLSAVDNGTVSGTVTGHADVDIKVTSGVKGKPNSALEFSKSGMYIDIPFAVQDCITFPDVCPYKQLTLSFMASFDNAAANWNKVAILDTLGGNENNSTGISVYITLKKLWFVVSYVNFFWKINIPIRGDNAWRHYVLTCSPLAINIHVNGKMGRSRAYVPTKRKSIHSKNLKKNMHIGLQRNSKVKSGVVRLSMLAFWDGIVPEKDIQTIYKTEFGWCPNGWTAFGMSCYLFTSDQSPWAAARARCQSLGGDLVTITTPVEQALITGRIQKYSWIGLRSVETLRQSRRSGWISILPTTRSSSSTLSFTWANSAPAVYTNWRSHTASYFRSTPTCVSVQAQHGTWAQNSCSMRWSSICEKEKVETKPSINTTGVNRPKFTRICQYSRDELSCPFGSVIKIHTAFWGRRHRSLCRYVSIIDCGLKTIKITTEKLRKLCDGSTNCKVYASNSDNHFGNPCIGVYKYLEVNYTCVLKKDLKNKPCPEDWVRSNVNGLACYHLIQSKKTWSDAENTCQKYNATLISIGGKPEQALATSLMERAWNTDVWIGLSDEISPKNYSWSDNSIVTWTNWGMGNPRGSWTGDHCVYMNLERATKDLMYWRTGNCSLEKLFICKKVLSKPSQTIKPKKGVVCPTGWTLYNSNCFKYFENWRTWNSARLFCQSRIFGAASTLASIADEEENEFVKKLSNATIWIGLEGRGVFRGHVWSDGSAVRYANWDIGQPDSYNGREACTQLFADIGYWGDVSCYSLRPFVCKRKMTSTTSGPRPAVPPTFAQSPRCKNGWTLFNDMCYYASDDKNSSNYKTWHESETSCRLEGGHLASVTSSEEKDFLAKLTRKALVYSFWIGLHDLNGESLYKWTDGTGYGTFVYWSNGEPNNFHGQEDCVAVLKISGKWNDNHCSQKKSYICKSKTEDATKVVVLKPATKVVKNGYCHSGWIANGRFCYKFYTDQTDLKSWRDARNTCEEGKNSSAVGELLSIANELEQAFITMNLKGSKVPLWIGMNNLHNYRSYYWTDSSPSNFYHWNKGQPLFTSRRCVEISSYERDAGKWSSSSCYKKNGYICKTAALSTPPTAKPSTVVPTKPELASFSCPHGFMRYDQSCYKFVNIPKTFDQAQDSCQKESASELISIGSEFEQALLVFLLERNLGSVWIGLNRNPWSALKFTDYSVPLYSYWGPGQPNRALDQRTCVQANVTGFNVGRWDDVDCNTKNPYVCEIYHGEAKITLEENSTCEAGWYKNQKYCYKYFPQSRSWAAARYACQSAGGDLVSIADEPEQDFVMFYFSHKPRTWVWIGLHDRAEEGGYEWSDKKPLTYVNWLKNQPNDPGQVQNCVLMDSRSGRWLDWRCYSSYSFICKRSLECSSIIPLKTDMITATNSIAANLSAEKAIYIDDSAEESAWCPNTTSGIKPIIKIDLSKLVKISSITIKGRVFGDHNDHQFVRSFYVDYSRDGWRWVTYTRNGIDLKFFANNDGASAVTKVFVTPVVASSIAIRPIVIEGQQPCMKLALRGCEFVCQVALGMNEQWITASSAKYPTNGPAMARPRDAGWCSQTNDDKQWIQVDFGRTNLVTKIRTYGAQNEDSYVRSYKIQFSGDGTEWVDYKQHGGSRIFLGNLNARHPMTHFLTDAFQATFIRIIPLSWKNNICMRFELFGCAVDCDGPLIQRYDSNEVSLVKITSKDKKSNAGFARMDSGKAWCPSDTKEQYLEVDFGKRVRLKHIAVRGSPANYGQPRRVVTYSLHLFRNKKWMKYMVDNSVKHIVSGNVNDTTALSKYTFSGDANGIIARKIRIYPEKFTSTGICMRIELYGCLAEEEIIPTKPTKTQIILLASIRITSMEWNDDYNDQTSKKFKKDSETIRKAVTSLYENNVDSKEGEALREVRVAKLRKGSTIADLELVFNPRFAKHENISKPLMDAVRSGNLGSLKVDKSYIKINEKTNVSHSARSGGNKISTGMVAGVVVAVLLVLLLVVGIGIYWRQKRKRDLYGPKEFNNPILYSTANTDEFDVE